MKAAGILVLGMFLLLANFCEVKAQQQLNMPVLSRWDDDAIPPAWTGAFSECWGYAAADREYAFIGSTQGTYFFDITDPVSPELIGYFDTKDTVTLVVNKDYATYDHYLYAVSDQGTNSLQIFDLQYLPDSVVKVYDSDAISKRCHTIFVEKDRLYMASNTRPDNSFGAMDIFSITDPLNPQLLGTLSHPGFFSVHETFVRNDTAYCANGNNGLWIYDLSNPAAPFLISIIDFYPESAYNHSAWLTSDSKTMVFTDEAHGKGVKVFDMTDIHDPQLVSMIRSNMLQVPVPQSSDGSVAHNPYIVNDILLLSYYHDGVVAYDISDPANPVLIGYNDIHDQNTTYYSYNGCWGLYPFLPSGNIIASDITNGLFILDGSEIFKPKVTIPNNFYFVPAGNPVHGEFITFLYSTPNSVSVEITIYDVTGKLLTDAAVGLVQGKGEVQLPVSGFAAGLYIAVVQTGEQTLSTKFTISEN